MNIFSHNLNIIELDRKYIPVPFDEKDRESLAAENELAQLYGNSFGQSIFDRLEEPLTVVLGEARSGKTTEFRLAAQKLNKDGQFAFFIRIEELVHPGVNGLFKLSHFRS